MAPDILPLIVRSLDSREPPAEGSRRAAVSVILTGDSSPSVLLIKRAERAGDPWSGQIAFPGGKAQGDGETARMTAVRETIEEVGIDLDSSSEFLGYLKPLRTHTGNMDVVPSAFRLKAKVKVETNEEVSSYKWAGLEAFLGPGASSTHTVTILGESREVPAFRVGEYVVWGLTHRILTALVSNVRSGV